MFRFLLSFSLIIGSVQAEHYIYKVEKGDNLSTIIYSSSQDNPSSVIKETGKINRIGINKIYEDQLLILPISNLNKCNTTIENHTLTIKEKLERPNEKENNYKECFKRLILLKEKNKKKRKFLSIITGRESIKLNKENTSFSGRLSTKKYLGYEIKIDLLEDTRYSLNFHHSLKFQDYKEISTMSYNDKTHTLPSFGISFMKNNTLASPFIGIYAQKKYLSLN